MERRTDRPIESGIYRMFTTSGNIYVVIADMSGGGKNGGGYYHVFQPRRFAEESYSYNGWDDTCRKFGPTAFELVTLADIGDGGKLTLAADLVSPFSAATPVTAEVKR
jgi:hypothetical protein